SREKRPLRHTDGEWLAHIGHMDEADDRGTAGKCRTAGCRWPAAARRWALARLSRHEMAGACTRRRYDQLFNRGDRKNRHALAARMGDREKPQCWRKPGRRSGDELHRPGACSAQRATQGLKQGGTEMARKGTEITLTSGDGAEILCYHAKAEGTRKGGLVLIMEIFGVTAHIKDLCDDYAARGYDVLSPQLYDRQVKDFQATYSQEDIQTSLKLRAENSYENTVLDVQMCIDKLRADGCEKVFITGY